MTARPKAKPRTRGSMIPPAMTRRHEHLDDGPLADLRSRLEELGCLNPTERAIELASRRRTCFYRPTDDSIVTATLKENP